MFKKRQMRLRRDNMRPRRDNMRPRRDKCAHEETDAYKKRQIRLKRIDISHVPYSPCHNHSTGQRIRYIYRYVTERRHTCSHTGVLYAVHAIITLHRVERAPAKTNLHVTESLSVLHVIHDMFEQQHR